MDYYNRPAQKIIYHSDGTGTFYTQADRSHEGESIYEWLVGKAKQHNITGITVIGGFEGVGHDGQTHQTNWFDSSQQPIRVIMVLNREKSDEFLATLSGFNLHIFYTICPVEYGFI
jgi:PII-like signaling protein